jgi:hypothetical protein
LMFLKNTNVFVNLVDVSDVPSPVKADIRRLTTN